MSKKDAKDKSFYQELVEYLATLIYLWQKEKNIKIPENDKILIFYELNTEAKMFEFLQDFKDLFEKGLEPQTLQELLRLVFKITNAERIAKKEESQNGK